ncbi:MAG: molybdopterin-guanine dinucleotide biosynthesis protein B [Nitrospinota bacterium]
MKPIISVVGRSNNGKTTFIERLIPELKKRGYKVGTIKHDAHKFDIDHEGKDTWRMAQAGADTVVIASDKKLAMVKNISDSSSEDEGRETITFSIDRIAEWLFPDVDIIITEGYKREDKPKIEVNRYGELLCGKNDNPIAIINNREDNAKLTLPEGLEGVVSFRMDEIEKIADMIEEKFL